jgi:chemotaxis protein methyltransferase CheR
MPTLTQAEFNVIAALLKERSGLSITFDKMYLIENRLRPLMDSHGIPNLLTLVRRIKDQSLGEPLGDEIVQAMTINESMFFRDQKPFHYLRDVVLPAFQAQGKRDVYMWSAACSHGQEPYSLAMMLQEYPSVKAYIYATDISHHAIERARAGRYTQFEVQRGLPIAMLMKYFTQHEGNQWQIADTIRRAVEFHTLNLLDMFVRPTVFDIVMCRYVLIYFDDATKRNVLRRIANVLTPGGYLLLGASETLLNMPELPYNAVSNQPGVFVRNAD